jgi:hypothetical protein
MAKKKSKDMSKKIKVQFAPGAFDNFEGTQEELDNLLAEITRMAEEGTLFDNSRVIDIEELVESDDAADQALATKILHALDHDINGDNNRNLQ